MLLLLRFNVKHSSQPILVRGAKHKTDGLTDVQSVASTPPDP